MWFIQYLETTRSPFYSFFFTLPLFFIYEVGLLLISSEEMIFMRNGADALMRQILSTLGINGFYWIGCIFFLGFLSVYYIQKEKWQDIRIDSNYLMIMMFESLLWAYVLFLFMSNIQIVLMSPNSSILIQQVTLAIGAGIYEEILFRVLLIAGLVSILKFIFNWLKVTYYIVATLISAAIFSLFHFLGEFGDYFSFNIFMVRFLAGIFLGALYFLRGFGITAWSHAIYDLIIITKITTK